MENKKIILVIEDEKSLREALDIKLTKNNFTVLDAENGKIGLELALLEHPDLIILDIKMPQMDGLHMLEKLREGVWGKTVPVIILTNVTSDNEQINKEITKYEPTFYFIKSDLKLEDLIEKIKERLGSL